MLELKKIDEKNKKVLEIVSSASDYRLLEKSGNDNLKICLQLDLCI